MKWETLESTLESVFFEATDAALDAFAAVVGATILAFARAAQITTIPDQGTL